MKPLSTATPPDDQPSRKTRSQLYREAEAAIAAIASRHHGHRPKQAEIVAGQKAKWYVIEVYASEQHDVAAELAKSRFGVYVPVVRETVISRGRKVDRHVPFLSGYVFVFMWFSDEHWRWISDTRGVIAILGWVDDEEIIRVRYAESWEQMEARDRTKAEQRLLNKIHGKRVGSSRRKKRRAKTVNGKAARAA